MEIKEIKQRLSIQAVLKHYNHRPDRNNMLKCPFHKEDTASMKIYPETNTFHCFGCGANGDVIEFIQKKENLNKHQALVKATELVSPEESAENKTKLFHRAGLNHNIKLMKQENPKEKAGHINLSTVGLPEVEIIEKIFSYFQNGLNSGTAKKPREYLQSRNLNHELVEMGYNSGQFHHRGKLSEQEQKACIDAGLLIPYKGAVPKARGATYTPFAKDCIIFPIKNKQNQIVSFYGRSITNNKNSKHFYLKDRTGLYPGYPDPGTRRLILTEAIIDAATLRQAQGRLQGFEVLACYGTNGLTAEHLEAIKELKDLEEIIFFFDGDKTGQEAVKKYQQELNELLPELKITIVETPDGEDINSLSEAYGPEIFTHLLESRKSFPATASRLLTEETEQGKEQGRNSQVSQDQKPGTGIFNTRNPEFITYNTRELKIVILGGINLQQLDRLRMTIKISRTDTRDPLHSIRHTLDLYHADYFEKFITKTSEQLEIGTNAVRRSLAELTDQIEQYRLSKIESLKEQKPKARELTEKRQRKAVSYLKSKNLMERTGTDIASTGLVGEKNNSLLMYLVFTSRLRDQPLHVISLGSSGTGKTYLQEKVSELIPEQDKLEITILSENAFYYFDRKELKHKLVLIEDMDGAENVLYPLRELQSKKKISKTIPIKDSKGNLKTITLRVEGPISLAGTTTRERLYEDNANRSLLIYLDGSREHKEQIMEYQRRLSAGKVNTRAENELKEFFKDMQTVLKPIQVRNPYAEHLKLPEQIFKPLRTNAHYLEVIETITFYHQYQREIKSDTQTGERYIETSLEDIEWANRLLSEVLLAKSDELNKAERSFFESLKKWLTTTSKTSFYAKDVREAFRMHPSKVKRYLYGLTSYNFIKITGGNRFKTGFEYEVRTSDEYRHLETSVNNILDDVLDEIKQKISGSCGLQVVHGQNRPLNTKKVSEITSVG